MPPYTPGAFFQGVGEIIFFLSLIARFYLLKTDRKKKDITPSTPNRCNVLPPMTFTSSGHWRKSSVGQRGLHQQNT